MPAISFLDSFARTEPTTWYAPDLQPRDEVSIDEGSSAKEHGLAKWKIGIIILSIGLSIAILVPLVMLLVRRVQNRPKKNKALKEAIRLRQISPPKAIPKRSGNIDVTPPGISAFILGREDAAQWGAEVRAHSYTPPEVRQALQQQKQASFVKNLIRASQLGKKKTPETATAENGAVPEPTKTNVPTDGQVLSESIKINRPTAGPGRHESEESMESVDINN